MEIESRQQFDMSCDLDVLGLLYWIEKEEIISKTAEMIDKCSKQGSLKRLSFAGKSDESYN